MESLEQRCLEKLDKILSKFDLAINIVNIPSVERQYRLVNNSLSKTPYSNCLGSWLSVSDILLHHNSIFECLRLYYDATNKINGFNFLANVTYTTSSKYQRYSKVYQFIQPLKSSCLEEFLIKCDLMGV